MIETDRLILRPWREGDGETFGRHTNTPAVMRWLGPLMSAEQLAAMEQRCMALQADRGHCFWIVERKADGEMLGFCGLKIADAPDCPVAGDIEIGWRLREDAWGHGYAKEAATASLDFAFDSEILLQAAQFGFRIKEVPARSIYFDDASSISFRPATVHGLKTVWLSGRRSVRTPAVSTASSASSVRAGWPWVRRVWASSTMPAMVSASIAPLPACPARRTSMASRVAGGSRPRATTSCMRY